MSLEQQSNLSLIDNDIISSLYVCMVNIKSKYNFVETPREFIIVKLSIRKFGSSSVLIIMRL